MKNIIAKSTLVILSLGLVSACTSTKSSHHRKQAQETETQQTPAQVAAQAGLNTDAEESVDVAANDVDDIDSDDWNEDYQ